MKELLDICREKRIPNPDFRSEKVTTESGELKYRVWVMLNRQKMELSTTFDTIEQGYERLSRVLTQKLEKGMPRAKKRKNAEDLEVGEGLTA